MNFRRVLAVAALGLVGTLGTAKADTFTILENFTTLPATDFITAPVTTTGAFVLSTTGSVANQQASPWGNSTSPYSIISQGPGFNPGTATYDLAPGSTTFSFLWGSPDSYNTVSFYSGASGGGSLIGSFSGSDLTCFSTACHQAGFDFVTFLDTGGTIGSVVLTDDGTAAFEYSNVTAVPGPIVGAGLPGLIAACGGLLALARRRRNKVA